jgi:beta-mannosidase
MFLQPSYRGTRVDQGPAHFFGTAAYLGEIDGTRRADVKFATECLAFSNVPHEESFAEFLAEGETPPTAPSWKAAVARDPGAAWDHEDVRDHYLRVLYRVDPLALRRTEPQRYLALSRVVTGEVMLGALTELRRAGSSCAGALILALRDVLPGPRFGLLEHSGHPKAAYWYARRACAPLALLSTNEGHNGMRLHAVNGTRAPAEVEVELELFRDGEVQVGRGKQRLSLAASSAVGLQVDDLLGHFSDSAWAFRFGPAFYSVGTAALRDAASGAELARTFFFPVGLPASVETDVGLSAEARALPGGAFELTVRSRRFAQSVSIDAPGFAADDDFFHLAPGAPHVVRLTPSGAPPAAAASIGCLNGLARARAPLVRPPG